MAAGMALPNLSALLFLKKEQGERRGESEHQSTPGQIAPSLQMFIFFFFLMSMWRILFEIQRGTKINVSLLRNVKRMFVTFWRVFCAT